MKRIALILALTATSARAQVPADPNTPVAEGKQRAKLIEKTGTAQNFTVRFKSASGDESTMQNVTNSDSNSALFESLVVGQEYDFPKTSFPLPQGVLPALQAGAEISMTFPDLAHSPPFRAKVTRKEVTDELVSLALSCTDGRKLALKCAGEEGRQQALKLVERLDDGGFYEFPHVFTTSRDVGQKSSTEAKPASPEMKALEAFIGQWESVHEDGPRGDEMLKYTWKADGLGMWREVMARAPYQEKFKMVIATLITYDDDAKLYVEKSSDPQYTQSVLKTWDAATRTLKGRAEVPSDPMMKVETEFHFTNDDRIEWKLVRIGKNGVNLGVSKGYYKRM